MYKLFLAHGGEWVESQRTFERVEDVIEAQTKMVAAALANGWNVGIRVEHVAEEAVAAKAPVSYLNRPATAK